MSTPIQVAPIIYPQSDSQPMADNTKQFRWIVTIQGGLDALFRDRSDIFVAGNVRAIVWRRLSRWKVGSVRV